MPLLIVIMGPENSGKYPLCRAILEIWQQREKDIVLLHRDKIRDSLMSYIDEGMLTHLVASMARNLLASKVNVLTCATNLHPADTRLWEDVAKLSEARIKFYDTRMEDVQKLIPPMNDKRRVRWGTHYEEKIKAPLPAGIEDTPELRLKLQRDLYNLSHEERSNEHE